MKKLIVVCSLILPLITRVHCVASLTLTANPFSMGTFCPRPVNITCTGFELSHIFLWKNGSVDMVEYSFRSAHVGSFPRPVSLEVPLQGVAAEVTTATPSIDIPTAIDIVSTLFVEDVSVLNGYSISCEDEAGARSRELNISVQFQDPVITSIITVISTYTSNAESAELNEVFVQWENVDQSVISEGCLFNDELNYTVVLEDNGTIIEQGVISSDSCVNGFCETSFVATSSNSYVVRVTATNGIGLSSATVESSTIERSIPFLFNVSFANCETSVLCSYNSMGNCTVQFTQNPDYQDLSEGTLGHLNSPFLLPLMEPTTTFYYQATVTINSSNTIQIRRSIITGEYDVRLTSANLALLVLGVILLCVATASCVVIVLVKVKYDKGFWLSLVMLVVGVVMIVVSLVLWVAVGFQVRLQSSTCESAWQGIRDSLIIAAFVFSLSAHLSACVAIVLTLYDKTRLERKKDEYQMESLTEYDVVTVEPKEHRKLKQEGENFLKAKQFFYCTSMYKYAKREPNPPDSTQVATWFPDSRRWPETVLPLKVYFKDKCPKNWKYNGSSLTHQTIMDLAIAAWSGCFTMGSKKNDFHIHVAFQEKMEENWTFLGYDAMKCDKSLPTMVLNLNSEFMTDGMIKATVIHQFGHALGLGHALMKPKVWKALKPRVNLASMMKAYNTTDRNEFDIRWSGKDKKDFNYDQKSVMRYNFIPSWLNENAPSNDQTRLVYPQSLSTQDKKALEGAYPMCVADKIMKDDDAPTPPVHVRPPPPAVKDSKEYSTLNHEQNKKRGGGRNAAATDENQEGVKVMSTVVEGHRQIGEDYSIAYSREIDKDDAHTPPVHVKVPPMVKEDKEYFTLNHEQDPKKRSGGNMRKNENYAALQHNTPPVKVAAPNPTYSTLDTPENTEGKDSREYNHAQKNGSKMEVVAANPSYSQTPFYSTLENTEGKDSTLNSDKEKKSTFGIRLML